MNQPADMPKPIDLSQRRTARDLAEVDKRLAEMLSAREHLHPGKLDAYVRAISADERDRILAEDRRVFLEAMDRRAGRAS